MYTRDYTFKKYRLSNLFFRTVLGRGAVLVTLITVFLPTIPHGEPPAAHGPWPMACFVSGTRRGWLNQPDSFFWEHKPSPGKQTALSSSAVGVTTGEGGMWVRSQPRESPVAGRLDRGLEREGPWPLAPGSEQERQRELQNGHRHGVQLCPLPLVTHRCLSVRLRIFLCAGHNFHSLHPNDG